MCSRGISLLLYFIKHLLDCFGVEDVKLDYLGWAWTSQGCTDGGPAVDFESSSYFSAEEAACCRRVSSMIFGYV